MQAIGKEAKKIESNIATLQSHYEQHVHPRVLWDVEVCAQPGRVYDAKGNQVRCFWEAEVYAECVCVYMAAAVHRSRAWSLPDLSSKQGSLIEHTLCSLHKNTFMVNCILTRKICAFVTGKPHVPSLGAVPTHAYQQLPQCGTVLDPTRDVRKCMLCGCFATLCGHFYSQVLLLWWLAWQGTCFYCPLFHGQLLKKQGRW